MRGYPFILLSYLEAASVCSVAVLCCSVSFSVEISVSVYFVAPAEGVSFV